MTGDILLVKANFLKYHGGAAKAMLDNISCIKLKYRDAQTINSGELENA